MANRRLTDEERQALAKYPVHPYFAEWLRSGVGRNAFFSRSDPALVPAIISKMMYGRMPISFEFAIRIERAQKPSKAGEEPLKAYDLMTFKEDRELYQWLLDRLPPKPGTQAFKAGMKCAKPRTVANAGA